METRPEANAADERETQPLKADMPICSRLEGRYTRERDAQSQKVKLPISRMLSGSVIASVFNTLGATFGNVIMFVIVAMIGNALNLVLNLLGCYVHDLRLQCLEFFNRFYKEGGRPYRPLAIETNYVDVIKEEK